MCITRHFNQGMQIAVKIVLLIIYYFPKTNCATLISIFSFPPHFMFPVKQPYLKPMLSNCSTTEHRIFSGIVLCEVWNIEHLPCSYFSNVLGRKYVCAVLLLLLLHLCTVHRRAQRVYSPLLRNRSESMNLFDQICSKCVRGISCGLFYA